MDAVAPTRAPVQRASQVAGVIAALAVAAYVVRTLVVVTPPDHEQLVLGAVFVLVAGLAWVRCLTHGAGAQDLVLAAGLTFSALGWAYWAVFLVPLAQPPYPSPADVLWSGFFPCVLLSLGWQSVARGSTWRSYLLDALIVVTGVTAMIGGVVLPAFVAEGASQRTMRVNVLYLGAHVAHLLLLSAVLAMRRGRNGGLLWVRLAGAALYCATNSQFLFQVADTGRVPVGTLMNLGWLVAFTLTAFSVGARQPRRRDVPAWRPTVLLLPVTGTALAVWTLVGDLRVVPWTRGMAGVAVVLALGRMALALIEADRLHGSHELAVTDELTGLPNRRGLYDALRVLLDGQTRATVLLIDLNRFKDVNDTLGHRVGDVLLAQVAARVERAVHDESDGRGNVARVGGDEFVVLLPGDDVAANERAASCLTSAICGRYEVDGLAVHISAAAGLVHTPQHGDDLDELLRRADVAMYAAKTAHETLVVYRTELDTRSREDLSRRERMRSALLDGGLMLHYQPKIDLRTGGVVGVEALARLVVDEQVLPPAVFLHVLDQGGLLRTLTTAVLEQAVAQAGRWRSAGLELSVAVNVPADSWIDADLARQVAAVLEQHDLPGSLLFLEVTEEALLEDRARGRAAIEAVRALGVRVSIDDYGTGYSSLAYLRDLPVDEIKLDRTFIHGMADDVRALTIVESSVALAHGLDLVVVAEGVEDQRDRFAALAAGCDLGQGYLFARPVPADELARLVDSWPVSTRG